jgi:hypothetical protein
LPAYFAGRGRIPGHHAGYATAGPLPGGRVLVLMVCVVVLIGFLWVPVLGDRLTSFVSKRAPRIVPRIFFLGLGILVVGLVAGIRVLDIVGGCMIGMLVLGAILDNY